MRTESQLYNASMQCNIDARGKRVRLVSGIIVTVMGVVLLTAWIIGETGWLAIAAGVMVLVGGFQIFEAKAGWCALRALGIRTRV